MQRSPPSGSHVPGSFGSVMSMCPPPSGGGGTVQADAATPAVIASATDSTARGHALPMIPMRFPSPCCGDPTPAQCDECHFPYAVGPAGGARHTGGEGADGACCRCG